MQAEARLTLIETVRGAPVSLDSERLTGMPEFICYGLRHFQPRNQWFSADVPLGHWERHCGFLLVSVQTIKQCEKLTFVTVLSDEQHGSCDSVEVVNY